MTTSYFDATAFVKLLFHEAGSDVAAALWDGSDIVVTSRLSHPEVTAAIIDAGRLGQVTPKELRQVHQAWRDYWAATRIVEFTEIIERATARLLESTTLGVMEAVHLASASAVKDRKLVVVTWDDQLSGAATEAGLRHAPAEVS